VNEPRSTDAADPSAGSAASSVSPPQPPERPEPLPADAQLWLIRHGETEWSKSGQHTGRTDIPLTEYGIEQAEALRPLLADLKPALVLCSPRQRSQRTADLAGVRVDAIDHDLAEWDYGEYEGLTSVQIRRDNPDWTIWTGDPPGGETSAQVGARANRVLARVLPALSDGPVLLFGHGHINRVLGARWIGQPVSGGGSFALGTAAPCLLGVEHSRAVIVRWNVSNPAVDH
jgi:broad specificity phosphatase PhoE